MILTSLNNHRFHTNPISKTNQKYQLIPFSPSQPFYPWIAANTTTTTTIAITTTTATTIATIIPRTPARSHSTVWLKPPLLIKAFFFFLLFFLAGPETSPGDSSSQVVQRETRRSPPCYKTTTIQYSHLPPSPPPPHPSPPSARGLKCTCERRRKSYEPMTQDDSRRTNQPRLPRTHPVLHSQTSQSSTHISLFLWWVLGTCNVIKWRNKSQWICEDEWEYKTKSNRTKWNKSCLTRSSFHELVSFLSTTLLLQRKVESV